MKTKLVLIKFLVVLFCITGCGQKESAETSGSGSQGTSQSEDLSGLIGEADPIANSDATVGGTLVKWGSLFPKSLNYFLDQWHISAEITGLQFETLVEMHSTKNEFTGILAESWQTSEDGLTFTFNLRKEARWSDGKPITSEDFQFYYDVIMNKKNLTPVFRVGLSRFNRPVIISEHSFSITASENHWANFVEATGLFAFPRHVWKDVDFNKQKFKFPVVSGPYKIKEGGLKKGRSLTMERREDWWGRALAYNKNKYNFKYIKFKFMEDQNKVLEAFKKGDLDVYAVYTSSIWVKKTRLPEVEKGWVARQQVYNKEPMGFQGMAINMRKEKFKDIRVRKALYHLINRRKMNEKLMYNVYFILNSYFPDLYPGNVNPNFPIVEFDPKTARQLLSDAGWKVNSKGELAKNGEVMEITFMTASPEFRHLNVYIEDLKSVGIKAQIKQISKSTLTKKLDEKDFDMHWQAWGASRLRNPESAWHSKYADQKASHNLPGVKDPYIDSLIEVQKTEMDINKRNNILRALDNRINEIVPYALLWQADMHRILYWNKFGTPEHVLDKFNREDIVVKYWFLDTEKEKTLEAARKSGKQLEVPPEKVVYQD